MQDYSNENQKSQTGRQPNALGFAKSMEARGFEAITSVLRCVISAPEPLQRLDKPPVAVFNRFQAWAYPELCLAQASEALSYCDEPSRALQRSVLIANFGLSL